MKWYIRTWTRIIFMVMIVVFVASCSSIEKPTYENHHVKESQVISTEVEGQFLVADVLSITDGDTLKISVPDEALNNIQEKEIKEKIQSLLRENNGEITIRYLAIDTPEITKGKNELYGQEAKEMVEYILSDDTVIIQLDPKAFTDNYGRLLGHVFNSDKESVQLALLESGLARVAYVFDDYLYVEEYQAASDRADNASVGVFSIAGYVTDKGFDMDAVSKIGNFDIPSVDEAINHIENMRIGDIIDIVDKASNGNQ